MNLKRNIIGAVISIAVVMLFSSSSVFANELPYADTKVTYDGKIIEARFGIYLSPTHHFYKGGLHEFTKMLNERSNGKIMVKEFTGEVLFKAKEGFQAIQNDICDITPGWPSYSPTGFNLSFAPNLPFMWENAYVASRSIEDLYPKYFKKEYEALGCKLLCSGSTSNYHLFTKKPITNLEQLKGMKVRSSGGMTNNLLKSLGMVPVSVPSPEIYTTMQRGMVDACIFSFASAVSYKLYEVCDYVTLIGPGFFVFAPHSIIVSPQWLSNLPPDLKKVVYGAARETAYYMSNTFESEKDESIKIFEDHGVKILKLSDDELDRWKKASQPTIDEWVAEMEAKGLPASKLVDEMKLLNEKYKNLKPLEFLELQRRDPVPMDAMW